MCKKQIILAIILISSVCSFEGLTTELILKDDSTIVFPIQQKTQDGKQCQFYVTPVIDYCSNAITETPAQAVQCGNTEVGSNYFADGNDYSGDFFIGEKKINFEFTIPNRGSVFYGSNQFCFGFKYDGQVNAFTYLDHKVPKQQIFLSLPQAGSKQNKGTIDIGDADLSKTKDNVYPFSLKSSGEAGYYSAYSSQNVQYGQFSLFSPRIVFLNINQPFFLFSLFQIQDLLKAFTAQGIKYDYQPNKNHFISVSSTDKLKNLEIQVVTEDSKPFIITVLPSQYTFKLAEGIYQVLIQLATYKGAMSLSNRVLETYYLGVDFSTKQILIAEKNTQQQQQQF
ncbi:hypothetical protein TTHERM_00354840 (macronuclear) [Tetrahymena thermophila SB210]|uniref:Transmembrane protein n=1 Tax=Tetrahymena thermophila (strain SB210) TaxID=312017 RepID=Q22Y87_TETTS|nr:hypothetical protein TTHERM_00354840 [Tetrahymena thermophila SB210]EAR90137.1 hypothetical protein TTHERM_00354840 [Tetrahymena thermophila SB210]|eukprot:XP_001010382.1 hypothetical protein TTHERM_00354840 [Tetrahymena thermophila SB210]